MTAEEKMLAAFSNLLYLKEGVRISPTDLRSTRVNNVLSEETLSLIEKNKEYFQKIEDTVTFIDDIRNPYGIYKFMREYAEQNGTQYTKKVNFGDKVKELDDYYVPNDEDEYVIIIIDHISLLTPENNKSIHEAIGELSKHLVKLRNKHKYIPVVVQQQASSQESIENAKANRLKPTLDGLGDNKMTQRDCNVAIGLFSPFRHEIPKYYKYDVTYFKDNIRFLEILASRDGGGGSIAPLFFDGCVNYFKELPHSSDLEGMSYVKKHIENIRK